MHVVISPIDIKNRILYYIIHYDREQEDCQL